MDKIVRAEVKIAEKYSNFMTAVKVVPALPLFSEAKLRWATIAAVPSL